MNHVALVIPGLDRIGGAERQAILIAEGLARRGWRVSVVALSGTGGDTAETLTAAGVHFLSFHMRKGLADPQGWIHFRRWLQQEKPDVVHAHLPHAASFARWSRLCTPMRVLIDTLHSSSTGSIGRHLGYRVSNWLPDTVTAVSHNVADVHLAAGMVASNKVVVVPNGVDVEAFRPDREARVAIRRELGFEKEFLWVAAGRLEAVKDYPTLLRAMAEVPEPARLVIAGAGPLESDLRRLSKDLGQEPRVRFLGFEPDVLPWMQAADGFVLSSRWEGLPMGLLEAAACALPAVATDVPGTREVIIPWQTASLAVPANARSLQGAMTRMMRLPPEERNIMGQQARQRVVEQFSLAAVLDRWEALYIRLLDRNPAPRRWGASG